MFDPLLHHSGHGLKQVNLWGSPPLGPAGRSTALLHSGSMRTCALMTEMLRSCCTIKQREGKRSQLPQIPVPCRN